MRFFLNWKKRGEVFSGGQTWKVIIRLIKGEMVRKTNRRTTPDYLNTEYGYKMTICKADNIQIYKKQIWQTYKQKNTRLILKTDWQKKIKTTYWQYTIVWPHNKQKQNNDDNISSEAVWNYKNYVQKIEIGVEKITFPCFYILPFVAWPTDRRTKYL